MSNDEKSGFNKAIEEIFDLLSFLTFNLANIKGFSGIYTPERIAKHINDLDLDTETSVLIGSLSNEMENRFINEKMPSYIIELAIVRLWSIFEAAFDDFAAHILSQPELVSDCEEVRKLKV